MEKVCIIPIVSGEQWCNVNCIDTTSDTVADITDFKTRILLEIVISRGRHNNPKCTSNSITPKYVKQKVLKTKRINKYSIIVEEFSNFCSVRE